MDSTEKFRQDVHYQIEQHSNRLDLPDAVEEVAKEVYDQYITQENAYSRPDEMFALGALYVGIRQEQIPLSLSDINTEYENDNLMRVFMRIVSDTGADAPTHEPKVFVDRITEGITGVSPEIGEAAKQIIEAAPRSTQGKRPAAVAAGAYYLAAKMIGTKIQQDLISNAAGVSKLTIRNRYQDIEDELADDFEIELTA